MTETTVHEQPRGFARGSGRSFDAPDLLVLPMVDPSVFTKGDVLARGGMGRITRARDRRLGRDVAIKEVLAPELRARFEREAMITARLQHPAIVPIYEAGTWPDGSAFYTMRLVAGGTLADALDKATTLEARLALLPHVIALTQALGYAHSRRVVHRDLKPANVLVDEFGETVVIDWGLAKELDRGATEDATSGVVPAAPDLTRAGSVVGTPCFIAPEQAAGGEIDERADVYALGAILYHLLAGHPPYWDTVEHSPDRLVAAACQQPPTPIGRLAPRAPADLRAIVERAMARDKAARFPTAKEMAEELRRFATGQLLRSREYRLRELLVRRIRQHRAAVVVGAIAICVLAIGGVVSVGRIVASERKTGQALLVSQHATAESQRATADSQRAAANSRRALAEAQLERGRQLVIDGDPEQAAAYLAMALEELPGDPVALRLATIALRDAHRRLGRFPGTAAAFRGDGRELAIGQADGSITMMTLDPRTATDPTAANNLRTLPSLGGAITSLAYASDDSRLAVASVSGAYLRDLRTGKATPIVSEPASEVLFLPGGNRFAIVSKTAVNLVGIDGKPMFHAGQLTWPHALAVSFDGAYLVALTAEGAIVWRAANLARVTTVAAKGQWYSATFDHGHVITAGMDGVRRWITPDRDNKLVSDPVGNLSWIDGHTLLADGSVIDTRSDKVRSLGHGSIQVSAVIGPMHVVTGGFDHMVRVWDVERATHPIVVLDAMDAAGTLRVDPNRRWAISRGHRADALFELWDVADLYAPARTANVHARIDNLLTDISSDHRDRVAVQVGDTTRLVLPTLEPVRQLDGHPLGFRPNHREIFTHNGSVLSIYSSQTGEHLRDISCPDKARSSEKIWGVAFSSDGTATVMSCEWSVWLRDTDNADPRVAIRGELSRGVSGLALDDHNHLVVGYMDGTLRIWDASPRTVVDHAAGSSGVETPGHLLATRSGHTATVSAIEIHGDTLFSTSWDQTMRQWALPSGIPRGSVFNIASGAARSPSGRWIATIDGSAAVSLRDGAQNRLLQQIPTSEELTHVVFVDDDHIVVGGKQGRLELIDLSERLRTAAEVIHMVDASPRWKLVGGQVVEQHL